jgi:putative prophage protein
MKNQLDKIISYMLHKKNDLVVYQIDKMLYFIQAYSLVKYDKVAFDNKIVCGFFGATVPDFSKNLKRYNLQKYMNDDYNSLDNNLKEIIDEVIESYSDYNEIALGGLTMSYIPFYSQENFNISDIGKIEVNPDWIKEYHNKRYSENNGYIF